MAWSTICRPKAEGGLGIKNCGLFNRALLYKWTWRFLSEEDPLWFQFLSFKYGDIKALIMGSAFHCIESKISLWWRDLQLVLRFFCDNSNWFCRCITCKLGSGNSIDFWRDCWIGQEPLSRQFFVMFDFFYRDLGWNSVGLDFGLMRIGLRILLDPVCHCCKEFLQLKRIIYTICWLVFFLQRVCTTNSFGGSIQATFLSKWPIVFCSLLCPLM